MDAANENLETGCCPRFDPEPWDEKEVRWDDKLFVKDRVRCFFHIPVNFGKVVVRNMEKIEACGAQSPAPMMLSDCDSLWGSNLFIHVAKDVPGGRMERISGDFLTKVFEGPYKDTGKWVKEMGAFARSKGREEKKLYFYYTTCPKCAKAYGKNYTVLLSEAG